MKILLVTLITLVATSCACIKKTSLPMYGENKKDLRPALQLEEVGPFLLINKTKDRHLPHLSAASGIQIVEDKFFVVADDELFLASFPLINTRQGVQVPALPGEKEMPADNLLRKKVKPDWESLVFVPSEFVPPYGALLLVPSGSMPTRQRAVLLPMDVKGVSDKPREIDLSGIYSELYKDIKELNIEGAIIVGNELRLFQRGNGSLKENAIVTLKMQNFIKYINKTGELRPKDVISAIQFHRSLSSVPVKGFSDAASLSNGEMLFLASVENTVSTFADGEILGSFLGLMAKDGKIKWMAPFALNLKAEGLAVNESKDGIQVFVVPDSDAPEKPAILYKVFLKNEDLK